MSNKTSFEGRRKSPDRPKHSFPSPKRWPLHLLQKLMILCRQRSQWSRQCSRAKAPVVGLEGEAGALWLTFYFLDQLLGVKKAWIWLNPSRIPSLPVALLTTRWCLWSTWSVTSLSCNLRSLPLTLTAAAERTPRCRKKLAERKARRRLQVWKEERQMPRRSKVYWTRGNPQLRSYQVSVANMMMTCCKT